MPPKKAALPPRPRRVLHLAPPRSLRMTSGPYVPRWRSRTSGPQPASNPESVHAVPQPASNPESVHAVPQPASNPESVHAGPRPARNPESDQIPHSPAGDVDMASLGAGSDPVMNSCDDPILWKPFRVFSSRMDQSHRDIALIVLNRPLEPSCCVFKRLWRRAAVRIFVDGAADQVSACLGQDVDQYVPDLITGDFDSASKSVLDHFHSKGARICPTPDQDYTDFHKSLLELEKYLRERPELKILQIYVMGALGGRLDHQLANLNVLHTLQSSLPAPVLLMDETNLAWLLPAGCHEILVDSGMEGDWCGLVPLGQACESVTTKGLHWDLDGQRMEMGGLISTSNRLSMPRPRAVSVSCSHPLLWCMGVNITS